MPKWHLEDCLSRYTVTPYRYRNSTYRTVISLGSTQVATTVNAYDYNAGCGVMASANEARDVIGALEWQDYQISLKPEPRPTIQPIEAPILDRVWNVFHRTIMAVMPKGNEHVSKESI